MTEVEHYMTAVDRWMNECRLIETTAQWLLAEARFETSEARRIYVEHLGEVTQLLADWSFAAKHEAWCLAESRWWAHYWRYGIYTRPFPWETP